MSVWKDGSDVRRSTPRPAITPFRVSPETLRGAAASRVRSATGPTASSTSPSARCRTCGSSTQDKDDRVPDPARDPRSGCRSSTTAISSSTIARARRSCSGRGCASNLGGIGKGYAVDRARAMLRESGLHDFMIQAGGDLYVGGRRGDRPWRLGIRDPRGPADDSFADARTDATARSARQATTSASSSRTASLPPHHRS